HERGSEPTTVAVGGNSPPGRPVVTRVGAGQCPRASTIAFTEYRSAGAVSRLSPRGDRRTDLSSNGPIPGLAQRAAARPRRQWHVENSPFADRPDGTAPSGRHSILRRAQAWNGDRPRR